jgi:vancomycin aglycone glucosyltransferase
MKVAIAAEGTRGDIHPMLLLARTMLSAGHRVRFCCPPDFAAEAAATGAEVESLGTEVRAFIEHRAAAVHGGGVAMMREMASWADLSIENQFRVLPDAVAGCDILFGAGTIVAGASAAELNGIPFRSILYTPAVAPSSDHTPCIVPFQFRSRVLNRLLWSTARGFLNIAARRDINRKRAGLGLPPVRDVLHHFLSERPVVAVDRALAPMPADCPFDWTQIRGLHALTGAPLSAKLENFLDQGPAPIYIGFGSMPDPDPRRTTLQLLDAIGELGCRAVISRGWAGLGEGPLPEGVLVVDAVDHASLFPRMAVIVHHGGSGTTHSAARAGVPQIIVPHVLDQFYFARRVVDLGVGTSTSSRGRLDVTSLATSLRALIDNEFVAERARTLGAELADLGRVEPDLDAMLSWR